MSAALRNQYLQTLGVVQYVSRDLPLVSPFAHPEETNRHSTNPYNKSAIDSPSKAVIGAPESLEVMAKTVAELSAIGAEKAPQARSIEVADRALESEELRDIALTFALWQPTDEVLVCCSVEDSLPDPDQILLLGNILLAMGQDNGPLPQMDIVQWPPFPNASGDVEEVRDFLATLIKARISSKSAKILLLMGDDARHWLLTDDEKEAVANGQVNIFEQVTALVVPSLKEMIEQPFRKGETWQTIRFLSPQRHVHKTPS